jgi:hypothetical protein
MMGLAIVVACTGGGGFYGQVNAPDGPVDGAEVVILDSSQNVIDRAITSSSGKFAVKTKLAPGVYVAEVKRQGFQTYNKTFSYPDVPSLDVSMVPQMTVKGIVRLPDQSVASKAIVTFKRNGQDAKFKTIADEGGNYMMEGLDAGEYTVSVQTPDGLNGMEIPKFTLDGTTRVMDQELVLQPAKREIETMEGDVQKSRVISGIDAPVQN